MSYGLLAAALIYARQTRTYLDSLNYYALYLIIYGTSDARFECFLLKNCDLLAARNFLDCELHVSMASCMGDTVGKFVNYSYVTRARFLKYSKLNNARITWKNVTRMLRDV